MPKQILVSVLRHCADPGAQLGRHAAHDAGLRAGRAGGREETLIIDPHGRRRPAPLRRGRLRTAVLDTSYLCQIWGNGADGRHKPCGCCSMIDLRGMLKRRSERQLYETMVRDNREGLALLKELFDIGSTEGVSVESIDGLLKDCVDPGESSQDLVRDARDRF